MTDEQLRKIEWLSRANYAEKRLKALEYRMNRDKERAQKINADFNSDIKGRSDSRFNNSENRFLNYAESEEKYREALYDYISVRNEIEEAVSFIADPVTEAIFIYRYLEYMPMAEIADRMMYDLRTVQRKHKSGLGKLPSYVSADFSAECPDPERGLSDSKQKRFSACG